MNENHIRHLVSTFRYIDKLLAEAEQILEDATSPSPFQEYSPDSTPVQRKVIHDYCIRLREAMSRIMTEYDIPRPAPVCGALWGARSRFNFISIAAAEVAPNHMRGYGELTDDDCKVLEGMVVELYSVADRLQAFLDEGESSDLQARLSRLEKTADEVRLLRELDRIITAHGLVEFRGAIRRLVDKLENNSFEIGVFGRVNSGKSSLLNHLLGGSYLPVGVTPVTAIPTRITYGPQPIVTVEFAEGKPQQAELSRLAEFSTEQHNPGNAKGVTRLRLRLPAQRLQEGVTFVDTPGLGSLATGGAEETIAYLPRCDLGLVLIDAGSTLTYEDLNLVRALYDSSALPMVLVSKADLLKPADRQPTVDYVQQHLLSEANLKLPVCLVSVVGADAALCDEWLETKLKPLLDSHREQAALSLKRKIGALRETVMRTLQSQRKGKEAAVPPQSIGQLKETEQALRHSDRIFEKGREKAAEAARSFPALTGHIIEIAAGEIAQAFLPGKANGSQAGIAASQTVARLVNELASEVRQQVEESRSQLSGLLGAARQALSVADDGPDDLPRPSDMPLFDAAGLPQELKIRVPAALHYLGKAATRGRIQKQLEASLHPALGELLTLYSTRMRTWVRRALSELQAAFSARAEIYRVQLEQLVTSPQREANDAQLLEDLHKLERWSSP